MISDGFSIGHLTLSISFESEVSTNLSPTFFIDFAPVFIYVTFIETGNSVVTSRSSAPSKSLIDKSAPFRTIRFNAGFPQPTGSRACGIDESQTERRGRCQIPSHSVFFATSKHPPRR